MYTYRWHLKTFGKENRFHKDRCSVIHISLYNISLGLNRNLHYSIKHNLWTWRWIEFHHDNQSSRNFSFSWVFIVPIQWIRLYDHQDWIWQKSGFFSADEYVIILFIQSFFDLIRAPNHTMLLIHAPDTYEEFLIGYWMRWGSDRLLWEWNLYYMWHLML